MELLDLKAAKLGFIGWHERGYLPHRDEPRLIQFVTFRLADSLPGSLRSEWDHILEIEDDRMRRLELESLLDRGLGHCYLRRQAIAKIVEDGIRMFHGNRYELMAWCVMSNHVHVLVQVGDHPLAQIMQSWKKHTAYQANRMLKRRGAFWARDYFDTFMRTPDQMTKAVRYIENNPTKAKLVLDPRDWSWSSARLRDPYGRLNLG